MSHQNKSQTVEATQQPRYTDTNEQEVDDSDSSKSSHSDSESISDNLQSNSISHSGDSKSTNTSNSSECLEGYEEGADNTDVGELSDTSNSSNLEGPNTFEEFKVKNEKEAPKEKEKVVSRTRAKLITERSYVRLKKATLDTNKTNPKVEKKLDNCTNTMCYIVARYHKELCVVFLLVASAFAALRSGPPKTRTVQTPQPFFPVETLPYLQDNYKGEYVDLVQKSIPVAPAFVFYYAPWDSESVASRAVFLSVAQHFHSVRVDQVKFFAVNCWWPEGQCRRNYKNLSHYPIFVAHIGTQSGIIYSGPIRKELMIRFIESVLKPITRLDTEEELWRFRTQHDAIMLASFNFSEPETAEAYETYLQMALRNFETDPFGQVGFGIFLRRKLGEKFFLTSANAISLVLFNEIHTAKWHGLNKTKAGLKGPVGQVVDWIVERTRQTPITWVYRVRNGFANRPISLGSNDFANELKRGPVFLLITRRYFPSAYSPFYAQVKEVALDYFNCNKSVNVTKLRRFTHKINAEWMTLWKSIRKICYLSKTLSPNCEVLGDQLKHWEQKELLFSKEALAHYENVSSSLNFTGSSCTSQRQFRFLTVDPVDVPHFISLGLGGLGASENSDPLAFIIDAKNEIILPFTTFNISDIARSINNFTLNMENGNGDHYASSSQRWVENVLPPTPEKVSCEESDATINFCIGDSKQLFSHPEKLLNQDKIRLKKFTSTDLLNFVNKTYPYEGSVSPMLMLYTAPYCGFCSIVLTHMIRLSVFLSEFYYDHGIDITIAKIDTLKNSLPLHLSPEHIPSVVFFPSDNRTNMRIFPMEEEINSKTLLRFLLTELDPKLRVQISLLSPSCSSDQTTNSTKTSSHVCIRKNKALVTNQIHSILEQLQVDLETEDLPVPAQRQYSNELNVDFELHGWRNDMLDHLRSMRLTLDTL